MKSGLAFLSLFLLSCAPSKGPITVEEGRRLTETFLKGNLDLVWNRFSPEMRKKVFRSKGDFADFQKKVAGDLGNETRVVEERFDGPWYVRLSEFDKISSPVEIRWALDGESRISGLLVQTRPQKTAAGEAGSSYFSYEAKTRLRLPFEGTWTVLWGGRTVKENQHAVSPDQRFAYDILIMREGSSHRGTGSRNDEFFCFGQRILSPADGTVVNALDGLPDNVPGSMDEQHPFGNYVVLDHGSGEFSFLAHLNQGSVKVRAGERVTAGQLLGLCGNSGRSTEPHLHYHLQDSGAPFKGKGLPATFRGYLADGQPVPAGEPVKGQKIEQAAVPN